MHFNWEYAIRCTISIRDYWWSTLLKFNFMKKYNESAVVITNGNTDRTIHMLNLLEHVKYCSNVEMLATNNTVTLVNLKNWPSLPSK